MQKYKELPFSFFHDLVRKNIVPRLKYFQEEIEINNILISMMALDGMTNGYSGPIKQICNYVCLVGKESGQHYFFPLNILVTQPVFDYCCKYLQGEMSYLEIEKIIQEALNS